MKPSESDPTGTKRSEEFETRSVRGTTGLGKRLGEGLEAGQCVALIGSLGAGKTALTRGIAAGLGVQDQRLVSSPTYVLVQEYPCRVPLYHIDLYRMIDPDAELLDLGLEEMLADGVVLIEWADCAIDALPADCIRIEIEITSPTHRRFTVTRQF